MYLTLKDIKAMNYNIISREQLNELEESEHVTFVECLGQSAYYIDYAWYVIELEDCTDIDVYIKINEI